MAETLTKIEIIRRQISVVVGLSGYSSTNSWGIETKTLNDQTIITESARRTHCTKPVGWSGHAFEFVVTPRRIHMGGLLSLQQKQWGFAFPPNTVWGSRRPFAGHDQHPSQVSRMLPPWTQTKEQCSGVFLAKLFVSTSGYSHCACALPAWITTPFYGNASFVESTSENGGSFALLSLGTNHVMYMPLHFCACAFLSIQNVNISNCIEMFEKRFYIDKCSFQRFREKQWESLKWHPLSCSFCTEFQ